MIRPELPENEAKRLDALYNLNILDTEDEERFNRIVRIAQNLFNVPIALISIVDANRQWFKSKYGIDAVETPRETSFCAHAILSDEIMIVDLNGNPISYSLGSICYDAQKHASFDDLLQDADKKMYDNKRSKT